MADSGVRELTKDELASLEERRRERRVPCDIEIRVASYNGIIPPHPMDYQVKESRDISASGISFFTSQPPETDLIVIRIGGNRNPFYVTAQVARCEQGYWNRRRQFVVGCRFTGQIPGLTWHEAAMIRKARRNWDRQQERNAGR